MVSAPHPVEVLLIAAGPHLLLCGGLTTANSFIIVLILIRRLIVMDYHNLLDHNSYSIDWGCYLISLESMGSSKDEGFRPLMEYYVAYLNWSSFNAIFYLPGSENSIKA